MNKVFHVYRMANKRYGTLYTGVTSDLLVRIDQHKQSVMEGFTKRYGLKLLVYFEEHQTAESAISREKQIKNWKRAWKIDLIEKANPNWHDLFDIVKNRSRL